MQAPCRGTSLWGMWCRRVRSDAAQIPAGGLLQECVHVSNGAAETEVQHRPECLCIVACLSFAGAAVQRFRPGDRVMSPFTVNCGQCWFCQRGLTARCGPPSPLPARKGPAWPPPRKTCLQGKRSIHAAYILGWQQTCRLPLAAWPPAGASGRSCLAGWRAAAACMAPKRSTFGCPWLTPRWPLCPLTCPMRRRCCLG